MVDCYGETTMLKSKSKRAGGKYTASHTTVIPTAGKIVDVVHKCPTVTKISLGLIKGGLRSAKGGERVKVMKSDTCLLLKVRGGTTHQELRVYARNIDEAHEEIVTKLKSLTGIEVV